jgi:hypothetical protein
MVLRPPVWRQSLHLIEIFLPVRNNEGRPFERQLFDHCQKEMTNKFGGATLFSRAPAHGTSSDEGDAIHDDIVVLEVMVPALDRNWWSVYRRELEHRFSQDEILIRATEIARL